MNMTRISLTLIAMAVLGQLTGCAQQAGALQQPAGDPPARLPALEAAPLKAAAAPEAAPISPALGADTGGAGRATDPIIIRGTDRMVAGPRNPAAPVSGPVSSLKFQDAPVGEVVKVMLNDMLKVDYVVHPPLQGSITLSTRETVPADKAMFLLEQALQANGIVIGRDARGTYHVGTPEALNGIVSAPQLAGDGPLPPGYGAVIVPLQYLGAGEMANILRPLVASDAILRVDTVRNILVMRGTRAQAEGWMDLVNTFDVNLLRGLPPLLVALVSAPLLGETLGAAGWLGIAAICGGVLGIGFAGGLTPGRALAHPASRAALLNALAIAAYTVVDGIGARLSGNPLAYACSLFVCEPLLILAWQYRRRGPAMRAYFRTHWRLGLAGALCSTSAYATILWAMTQAPVAMVAALRESSVVFAVLIGSLWFGEGRLRPGLLAGAGVVLGIFLLRG